MRPIQLWVADTRRADFPKECKRQCLVVQEHKRRVRRRPWIKLRRGDLVTLRPARTSRAGGALQRALVIRYDHFDAHALVAILPLTSELRAAPLLRVAVVRAERTAPGVALQVMIDRPQTIPVKCIRGVFGHLSGKSLLAVDRALAVYLGIAR